MNRTLNHSSLLVLHYAARQIREAVMMLKSAVLFTKRMLHFHVIADSMKLFGRLVNSTAGWPDTYRKKIRLSMHDVWYPEVRRRFYPHHD